MFRRLLTVTLALAPAAAPLAAQIPQSEYQQRRDALASRVGDAVVVALGAPEPAQDYLTFYQNSPFTYLTGFREPDAALIMVRQGGALTSTLFVQPKDPAREVWTGNRLGVAGVAAATGGGMRGRAAGDLRAVLDSLAGTGLPFAFVGDFNRLCQDPERDGGEDAPLTPDDQLVQSLKAAHPGLRVGCANGAVWQLRGKKSAAELALIRRAVDITVLAEKEAMRAVKPGRNEFEIQGLIEYTFRRYGADRPSFATIVGSGPNSTTLHYNADDRFMNAGETVVMDIGASARGYAADVTRTVPVGGTFTPEQRAVYQLVRDTQAAAERQAKLGAPARLMEDSAQAVLKRGLARLGLIESPDAVYDCAEDGQPTGTCPQFRLYYMHGIGHGIGLDVHDPDQFYFTGRIAPGSAFTIEPGVYVRGNTLEIIPDTPRNRAVIAKIRPAVQRYANVGVRIEDDYIATEQGVEWISRAPRELAEVEAAMREPEACPANRNAAMVEWYRTTTGNK